MTYKVFRRAWWQADGKTPNPGAHKTHISSGLTYEEARALCTEYNDGPRTPYQVKRGIKYEFTSQN